MTPYEFGRHIKLAAKPAAGTFVTPLDPAVNVLVKALIRKVLPPKAPLSGMAIKSTQPMQH